MSTGVHRVLLQMVGASPDHWGTGVAEIQIRSQPGLGRAASPVTIDLSHYSEGLQRDADLVPAAFPQLKSISEVPPYDWTVGLSLKEIKQPPWLPWSQYVLQLWSFLLALSP